MVPSTRFGAERSFLALPPLFQFQMNQVADEDMQRFLAAVTNINSPKLIKNFTEIAESFAGGHA
jgi:hypothetical protein